MQSVLESIGAQHRLSTTLDAIQTGVVAVQYLSTNIPDDSCIFLRVEVSQVSSLSFHRILRYPFLPI